MVRRDINRLNELVSRESGNHPALGSVADIVATATAGVNSARQAYQGVAVRGDKEREERELAVGRLMEWIQQWRPVIMLRVPGADQNIRTLPARGAVPDDIIRVAQDMLEFMNNNTACGDFSETAVNSLGSLLEDAKKETSEASAVLPEEAVARDAYTEACLEANTVLVRTLDIVRSLFGRTSPEYKQFIARDSSGSEEEDETVPSGVSGSQTGE